MILQVKVGKKVVCFEVETGSNIEGHGPEHVIEKMEERKKECDKLIVVVTNRRLKGKYVRLSGAKTITRTEVVGTIATLLKSRT